MVLSSFPAMWAYIRLEETWTRVFTELDPLSPLANWVKLLFSTPGRKPSPQVFLLQQDTPTCFCFCQWVQCSATMGCPCFLCAPTATPALQRQNARWHSSSPIRPNLYSECVRWQVACFANLYSPVPAVFKDNNYFSSAPLKHLKIKNKHPSQHFCALMHSYKENHLSHFIHSSLICPFPLYFYIIKHRTCCITNASYHCPMA